MTTGPQSQIRNFAIIAHIDHGKSTLADRLIQTTGGLQAREMKEQVLDSMDIERERGITIKAQTVRLAYRAKDGKDYVLNLIDTPGHVDFAYEVSRSLAACEGSLLVVDASQGVEAQTLANVYQAIDNNHEIVPILNKVDLPAAEPDKVRQQIEDVIGIDASDAILISAKTGIGIGDVLEAIVTRLPPPQGDPDATLKALLVDSWYDAYLGVVVLVRIVDGRMKKGDRIRMMGTGAAYDVDRVGVFTPKLTPADSARTRRDRLPHRLDQGSRRHPRRRHDHRRPEAGGDDAARLPSGAAGGLLRASFRSMRRSSRTCAPRWASSASTTRASPSRWRRQRRAGLRLPLRLPRPLASGDHPGAAGARVQPQPDRDRAVRHLPDEADRRHRRSRFTIPSTCPTWSRSSEIDEPWIEATVLTPDEYLGSVIKLCQDRRGIQKELTYVGTRALVKYDLPLNEVVFDFYDRLKSVSKGYASFDYHLTDYRPADLVKMQILVNGDPVDALSMLVHRTRAETRGRGMVEKLKELIPPHMFVVPIQAAIGGKIIARETVRALRKDVTAKCYGGDATRKRKLLDKQKEGKKKMRQFGKVDIPQEAFIAALKIDE